MTDDRMEQLIRENERYKSALLAIYEICRLATFGAWRFRIGTLVNIALSRQ